MIVNIDKEGLDIFLNANILAFIIFCALDIPILMKLTKWRSISTISTSLFLNIMSALSFGILTIFLFKGPTPLIHQIFVIILAPLMYLNLPKAATFVAISFAIIPFFIIRPLFKTIFLKLLYLMFKTKQRYGLGSGGLNTIGFKGFLLFFLTNIMAIMTLLIMQVLRRFVNKC